MTGLGPNQKKILLLLLGGLALSMNSSKGGVPRIARAFMKEWKKIDRQSLDRSLKSLEIKKYVAFKKKGNCFFPALTAKGRKRAFFAELQAMTIPVTKKWDGLWRIVLFDIPEDDRKIRDYLRKHLKRMNFFKLQKSVLIQAFDCKKEIQKISNYYGNGDYIRFIVAKSIDNESEIKKYFHIS